MFLLFSELFTFQILQNNKNIEAFSTGQLCPKAVNVSSMKIFPV